MTARNLFRLVRLGFSRDKRGAFFSAFGVAIGIGSLVFFVGLGLGVGEVIREKVFPVDARLVDVVPSSVSLGSFLGGGKLDQATADRLAALPEVAKVHRKMNVRVPAVTRYDGSFFGSRLRMGLEVLVVGVDPGLVEGDVDRKPFADPGPSEGAVPAVASTRLLEIYNKTFAPARNLPQLSRTLLIGFRFPVEFNRSYVAQTVPGPATEAQFQVVGLSDRALLAGVTVPLETAVRINRASGVDAETFTSFTVEARDPSDVPKIVSEVKRMGLQIDDQERRLAENAGAAVAVTTSAMALLSALICLLAAVNIAHALSASVRARAKEIGVMRAVGASRSDVRNLVFAEAALTGLIGGLAGTGLAVILATAGNRILLSYLGDFPFKPESFFAFPPLLWVGGVALGVLAAIAGAYFPSRHAAAMDPARTLAG